MKNLILVAVLLAVSGCAGFGFVAADAGCTTYGIHRGDMPTLALDPVSEWVDVLDAGMTGACRTG